MITRRIIFSFVTVLSLCVMPFGARAAADDVTVYLFYGDGCPHCQHEEAFLDTLEAQGMLRTERLEVWYNPENRKLLQDVATRLGITVSGVPVTVIRDKAFVGWQGDETSGAQLVTLVNALRGGDAPDVVAEIRGGTVGEGETPINAPDTIGGNVSDTMLDTTSFVPDAVSSAFDTHALPSLGGWSVAGMSLPFATAVFGLLDGFNPCAMWALVFLITLLFHMKDRRKMWILGGTFILVSGIVYFLFLAAWLNVMFVLGGLGWMRAVIGLVALGGGGWYLYEWKTAPPAGCVVTNESQKERLLERMRGAIGQKSFLLSLGGIIVVAVLINAVELVCSAGLPAVYTQIIALHDLPFWAYYGYLLLYVLFFMLDDMIVFGAAMATLRLTGINAKYTRISHLIGGILMIIIGMLLIFKPELLLFG